MKMFFLSFRDWVCLVLGMIVFATVISLKAESSAARISIKAVNGNATSCTNGTTFQPLHAGDFTGPGSILKTDSSTTVDLILLDSGTVLRMLPDTTLQLAKLNKQKAGEQIMTETSLK